MTIERNTHWYVFKNHHKNFVIFNNEILMERVNGKPINALTTNLFVRILNLPSSWKLTVRGLHSITGYSTDQLTRCINELTELGYMKKICVKNEKAQIIGYHYFIFETKRLREIFDKEEEIDRALTESEIDLIIDEEEFNKKYQISDKNLSKFDEILEDENQTEKNFAQNEQENDLIFVEKSVKKDEEFVKKDEEKNQIPDSGIWTKNQIPDFRIWKNQNQEIKDVYKTCNNKTCNNKTTNSIFNNIKNRILLDSKLFINYKTKGNSPLVKIKNHEKIEKIKKHEKIENQEKHETCKHDSLENLHKNFAAKKSAAKKSTAEKIEHKFKNLSFRIAKDEELKNPEEKIKQKNISTIETQGFQKLNSLTKEDNEVAQDIKLAAELVKKGKAITKTHLANERKQKKLVEKIKNEYATLPYQQELLDYCEMHKDIYYPLAFVSLKMMVSDLNSLVSNNFELAKEVVRMATKKSWKGFYLTDDIKESFQQKKIKHAVENYSNIEKQNEETEYMKQNGYSFDEQGRIIDSEGKLLEF